MACFMRQETLTFSIALLCLLGARNAGAEITFWLSPNGVASAAPGLGETPELTKVVGSANQEIHIWAKPDSGTTLENFSMNLVSTAPDVIAFTGVEVHQSIDESTDRFEFTFDSTNDLNPDPLLQTPCPFDLEAPVETALWGFKGFSISDASVGVGQQDDPRYDAANQSWLLATVSYDVEQEGTTDFYLQIGEVGMNLTGATSATLDVVLGDTADTALNARDNHCEESSRADATINAVTQLLGDFDSSGVLDAPDIDLLSEIVQAESHELSFDLTGDNLVTEADRIHWVTNLAGTFFGDADLDKAVAFGDFVTLATHFGEEGGWAQGDFDGNQAVAFGDFVMLATNFGQVSATAAVPEPGSQAGMAWAITFLLALRTGRRRNRHV